MVELGRDVGWMVLQGGLDGDKSGEGRRARDRSVRLLSFGRTWVEEAGWLRVVFLRSSRAKEENVARLTCGNDYARGRSCHLEKTPRQRVERGS